MKKVLVGFDGSEESKRALTMARELTRATGATLILANIFEVPTIPLVDYGLAAAQVRSRELERRLELLRDVAEGMPGVSTDLLLETGRPAEVLAAAAQEKDVDMVVVGSRGLGKVEEVLLGSVSARLVHLCRKPILVVP